MREPAQGEFGGASSATEGFIRLEDEYRQTFLGQTNGCRQTVWSRPDDNAIVRSI
jgi:hypothetical protein